ncbi:PTS glucose transporter subunit IIA, partial [Staphylococcus arlettae]
TNSPIIITNSDQTSDINFAEATDLIKGETKIADVTMK